MQLLMKGNEALAEGALRAGCRCFFGYPITPQTEVAAYMAKHMQRRGGVYLQAESELAAINMVLGASSAGVRAMTSSSSPGISLKTEAISYMAGSDLPGVIVNVQRAGPGLGGIQASQADYWQATRAPGHGDLRLFVLAPASAQEMFDLIGDAFDLSDLYRMPAMILADGVLGQMMEPVELGERAPKKLPAKDWALTGTRHKRPHNVINSLYLDPAELERKVTERFARYEKAAKTEQRAEEYLVDDAELVLVAYGASARVARTAVDEARAKGRRTGLIRPVTLWPFPVDSLRRAAKTARAFIAVEMSMGQMVDDVRLAIECARPVGLLSRTGGIIPSPEEVLEAIERHFEGCGGKPRRVGNA